MDRCATFRDFVAGFAGFLLFLFELILIGFGDWRVFGVWVFTGVCYYFGVADILDLWVLVVFVTFDF